MGYIGSESNVCSLVLLLRDNIGQVEFFINLTLYLFLP